jgi:rubredoxin
MKNAGNTMNRRQFMKSTALTFWGLLSFILLNRPLKAKAQSEKDVHMMSKYICEICGYIYDPMKGDPSQGIPAGTSFEKLPDDWKCPICGVEKNMFKKMS